MRKRNRVLGTACLSLGGLAACGGRNPEVPAPATVDRAHYESVMEMIRGKAPGVQVIEVSPGHFELRIRGMHQSLQTTGQEPLVVLDGMASNRPAGELLMSLNPQDVVSIQVLKDVSSTAVFGMRGANGVLIVQTKRRR